MQGTQGLQGIQGTLGNQGIQGLQGLQGSDATMQGTQGRQGVQGIQGVAGFGIQGFQGTTGSGNQGVQGTTGSGSQGVQGAQGIQGTNATGSQGIQGIQGTTGTGSQGIQGVQGIGNQGIQGLQGTSGPVSLRGLLSGSSGSLANNATADISITGYKTYALLAISTSAAAWVRIYSSSTARSNDASRTQGTDPSAGSGVIAEVITTGNTTQLLSPAVLGYNESGTTVYIAITNISGATATINISLTALQLEA